MYSPLKDKDEREERYLDYAGLHMASGGASYQGLCSEHHYISKTDKSRLGNSCSDRIYTH